jgi:hypothetical protein
VAAALGAAAALLVSLAGLALVPGSGERGPQPFPGEEIERAFREHRYEDAARLATAAGDAASAARAQFLSGNLGAAAAAFAAARQRNSQRPPTWDELDSHIAVHDWERAAIVADLLRQSVPSGADGLPCLADVLRMKANPGMPAPQSLRPSGTTPWVCDLAFADIADTRETRMRLETLVSTRHFGFLRPGPPPRPRGHDADARVAALLLARRGQTDDYPFSPPHGAHVLLCEGPMFRMPVPALTAWIAASPSPVKAEIVLETTLISAAWSSCLGDHEAAGLAYEKAMWLAGLPEAAPHVEPAKGRYFSAPRIHDLLGRRATLENPGVAEMLAMGTALALRAGEPDAANTYVDVVTPEDDRTEVRRFVWAALGRGDEPLTHLRDQLEPKKRAFLEAGVRDDLALLVVLQRYDGQGLWPVVGHRLQRAAGHMREWAAGSGARCNSPSRPEGCGFYGLLGHWAARRDGARSMMAWEQGLAATQRLDRMRPVLADREAALLLYATGRLASPEDDE